MLNILLVLTVLSSAFADESVFELYNKIPASYSYIQGEVDSFNADASYASETYVTPASCLKVITALAAIKVLGDSFSYETKLYQSSNDDGQPNNIMLSFSGDPELRADSIYQLLLPLRHSVITGSIILDASAFNTVSYSPNNMLDDKGTYYAQPVSSMNIDKNIINISLKPSKVENKVLVKVNPSYPYVSSVVANNTNSQVNIDWRGGKLDIRGYMKDTSQEMNLRMSPENIEPYVIDKIKKIMNKLDIKGDIIVSNDQRQLPKNMKLISTHHSRKLPEMLSDAMRTSDNLVFDSLYLTMIHRNDPSIKLWDAGGPYIKSVIKKYYGVDLMLANIVDGSGLSRYNTLKSQSLFELLKKAYGMKMFMDTLPYPGLSGSSLEHRKLPKMLRAKTGKMTGVRCLCGYFGQIPERDAFVLIANNFGVTGAQMETVMDQYLTQQILEYSRTSS